jgi:hypothetical protein
MSEPCGKSGTLKYGTRWTNLAMAESGLSSIAVGAFEGMAMDAALSPARSARDQDPPKQDLDSNSGQGGDMEKIKLFLKNRLDPADYQQLCAMMKSISGGGSEEEDPTHVQDPMAKQSPEDEQYMRQNADPKKEYAQDSSRRGGSYLDAFPMNARVKFGYGH